MRSTNNQYVCKYIGRVNDQSNWSGPFSLVVMTLDYRSRGTWFDPRSGHSMGIFSLQVYFSSYYNCGGSVESHLIFVLAGFMVQATLLRTCQIVYPLLGRLRPLESKLFHFHKKFGKS